jgi:hypothetical protein
VAAIVIIALVAVVAPLLLAASTTPREPLSTPHDFAYKGVVQGVTGIHSIRMELPHGWTVSDPQLFDVDVRSADGTHGLAIAMAPQIGRRCCTAGGSDLRSYRAEVRSALAAARVRIRGTTTETPIGGHPAWWIDVVPADRALRTHGCPVTSPCLRLFDSPLEHMGTMCPPGVDEHPGGKWGTDWIPRCSTVVRPDSFIGLIPGASNRLVFTDIGGVAAVIWVWSTSPSGFGAAIADAESILASVRELD